MPFIFYIVCMCVHCADLYECVIAANRIENSELRMLKLKRRLHELPEHNFETFRFLSQHLNKVATREEQNKVSHFTVWAHLMISLCLSLYLMFLGNFAAFENENSEMYIFAVFLYLKCLDFLYDCQMALKCKTPSKTRIVFVHDGGMF